MALVVAESCGVRFIFGSCRCRTVPCSLNQASLNMLSNRVYCLKSNSHIKCTYYQKSSVCLKHFARILNEVQERKEVTILVSQQKVKVKLTLEQATKARRGSRCIALLFLQLRRQLGGGWWSTPRLCRFTPRERPGTRCIGGWMGPGPSSPQRVAIPTALSRMGVVHIHIIRIPKLNCRLIRCI